MKGMSVDRETYHVTYVHSVNDKVSLTPFIKDKT